MSLPEARASTAASVIAHLPPRHGGERLQRFDRPSRFPSATRPSLRRAAHGAKPDTPRVDRPTFVPTPQPAPATQPEPVPAPEPPAPQPPPATPADGDLGSIPGTGAHPPAIDPPDADQPGPVADPPPAPAPPALPGVPATPSVP